jgi:flagellum-specific peptidoglycan hydrolase FlgJ
MINTKVPASITLAQAALESNWGRAAPGNNFFGVKGTGPAGTQMLMTWEVFKGKKQRTKAPFRKYFTPLESFIDHAKVISTGKYLKHAMEHTESAEAFITALQKGPAKYATDPDYKKKILSIVQEYDLEQYDILARQKGAKK